MRRSVKKKKRKKMKIKKKNNWRRAETCDEEKMGERKKEKEKLEN